MVVLNDTATITNGIFTIMSSFLLMKYLEVLNILFTVFIVWDAVFSPDDLVVAYGFLPHTVSM